MFYLEPSMFFDVVVSILLVTDSFLRILSAERLDKRLCLSTDLVWELDGVDSSKNAFVNGEIILCPERCFLRKQLVDENTERPEISADIVTSVGDNFRRNVLGCSTESPRLVSRKNFLGETKIDESDIAVSINHQIFWFKISVAVVASVEVFERGDNTGGVESTNGVIEWASLVEESPEIATKVGIGKDVDVLVIYNELNGALSFFKNLCKSSKGQE